MSAELLHAHEWDTDDVQKFVGLGAGRDEIFSYQFRNGAGWRESGFDTEDVVRTFEYSPVLPHRVGYGLNSGAVHVRDLTPGKASEPLIFKQRATRKCNAIAFTSEMLMASGYEKTRGLESLLIWDLNVSNHTPLKSVNISDTIAAAKFVPTNPSLLILGSSRNSREYDLRADNITTSVATNMYMQITFNPFNDHNFATHGESNHIALWDRRMSKNRGKQAEPSLVIPRAFRENQKFDTRCFRYSSCNENEVAVLNDGSMIRRWQVSKMMSRNSGSQSSSQLTSGLSQQKGSHDEYEDDAVSLSGASDSGVENAEISMGPEFTEDEQNPDLSELLNSSLFVNKVFEVQTENDKVVSFDYAKDAQTGGLEFVCLRQSGTVFRMPVSGPPLNIYIDPFNDFRMVSESNESVETTRSDHSKLIAVDSSSGGHHRDCKVVADEDMGHRNSSAENKMEVITKRNSNSDSDDDSDASLSDPLGSSTSLDEEFSSNEIGLPTLLNNDIASAMQRRALAGYSLDAAKNIELLLSSTFNPASGGTTGSSGLLAAWKWVKRQQGISENVRNYSDTPELDLRYIGVYTIWNGSKDALLPRLSSSAKLTGKTLNDALKYALRKSAGSVYVKEEDDKTLYRQLCSRSTGWDFGLNELESRSEQSEKEGHYEKAAGWAAFHNNVERAVESLAKSPKKNSRLMSTAVAGYLVYKDVTQNNVWREQCRRLASELSVPYLRAVFAYISDGSWLDVLDDGSLPLTERLGIALRFLPQKEVGKYLSLVTSRVITNGDLEGIILTGFTPKVLDLFQAYSNRTGDIQTVCLLVSFGWPRYFDDPRFKGWFMEYRQLLNSWKYFTQRARLDIARSKFFKSKNSNLVKPIQGQVFLRCSNCKEDMSGPAREIKRGQKGIIEPAYQLRNRCLYCNHPLPPCGICTLPLGPNIDDEVESDRWPTFCLKCNHGHHSVHARQWFKKYDVCPMPSCSCMCGKTA